MTDTNYDLDTAEGLKNAIAWQRTLINYLPEGGVWAVPRAQAIYTLYHSKQLAVTKLHDQAVDYIFAKMGWEVREEL